MHHHWLAGARGALAHWEQFCGPGMFGGIKLFEGGHFYCFDEPGVEPPWGANRALLKWLQGVADRECNAVGVRKAISGSKHKHSAEPISHFDFTCDLFSVRRGRCNKCGSGCSTGYLQINPKHESDKEAFNCGTCGCDSKEHEDLGPQGFCTQLNVGTRVCLHSLVSAARLNGQYGMVKSEPSGGRYSVQVRAHYASQPNVTQWENVSVKPSNLLQLPRAVLIRCVRARPELNGQYCNLIGRGLDSSRFTVELCNGGDQVSLHWRNMVMPAGTKLFLPTGTKHKHSGDTLGTVLQLDVETEQYLIQVQSKPSMQQWFDLEQLSLLGPVG